MQKTETLGQFEQLVLAAVRMIDKAYAVPIHEHVERLYKRSVKIASIYTTVDRLEAKGYIKSRPPEPTSKPGNKPKQYYSITRTGEKALQDSAETAMRFLESLRARG